MPDIRFIVLTGGPGAGKTAVIAAARQIFHQLTILPEAASIVYSGGFPRQPVPFAIRAAQRAIFRVQEQLENYAREERACSVALCDRGIADGAAYWPDGHQAFFKAIGLSRSEIFRRYHTVIHLRTPSVHLGYTNHTNLVRTESPEEAAALDMQIEKVWEGHPNRLVVPATESFPEKLDQVTDLIRAALPLERAPSLFLGQQLVFGENHP